ncbi:MAG TPA: dihydrofolate reductase family protein [Ktedonobacterales bacterium]|nr:dihydrofolate reductase family protein [Ktedonobacterales bacterium]
MRQIIVSERITLDGFITRPDGAMDWMEPFFDDELANYEAELQKTVDTALLGRETYQGFASYWPTVPNDPASPQGMVEYANRFNAMRKVVFSRTLARAEWNNSTVMNEIVPEDITSMKREPGRDMVIFGSASVVRALTRLGLIDTYNLLVFPVVIGSGRPLFHNLAHSVNLKLVHARTHPSGVVALSYHPARK